MRSTRASANPAAVDLGGEHGRVGEPGPVDAGERREVRVQEEPVEVLGREGRDREPPGRSEHARDLGQRRGTIRERVHDQVHVGGVEPAVAERQPLGDALLPADPARVRPGARPRAASRPTGRRPRPGPEPLVWRGRRSGRCRSRRRAACGSPACPRGCARPARPRLSRRAQAVVARRQRVEVQRHAAGAGAGGAAARSPPRTRCGRSRSGSGSSTESKSRGTTVSGTPRAPRRAISRPR